MHKIQVSTPWSAVKWYIQLALAVSLLLCLVACDTQQQALKMRVASKSSLHVAAGAEPYQARTERVTTRAVVEDLELPWDMAFVSEREILVTEKPGRLSRINLDSGEKITISGLPEVAYRGQGGLLGVVLHPDFADNGWLYLSYAVSVEGGSTTRLLRARLRGTELREQQVLFTAQPAQRSKRHFGGALVFDQQGYLYLSVGDRGKRHQAQKLDSHLGKLHRLHDDGSIPADNPFVNRADARPEIYSWGHRNPQGLAIHPVTGALWEAEHGPRGGDEVNLIEPGKNYGWPVITYGEEYRGGKIGEGTAKPGMEQPVHYYVPSIGTAGISFYHGESIKSWHHNLFVAGLVYTQTHLSRLELAGKRVVEEEPLFENLKMRIRNVASSPAGELYVLSDSGVIFVVAADDVRNSGDTDGE